MAYLEAYQELRDHPKTKRAARLLGIARPQMIGHLMCLWWWCMDYAQDGDLSDFDNADIADAAEWEGDPDLFVHALSDCGPADRHGFLARSEDGLTVNDWQEYGGKYIAKRNQGRERQRQYRQRNASVTRDNPEPQPPSDTTASVTNASVTQDTTDSNALLTRHSRVSNAAREEKRREEKTLTATPSAGADQPQNLGDWLDILRESKNRNADLVRMFKTLYPQAVDVPDYGYIGKVANKVGGAGRLAELLWHSSTRPPTGDVLAYIQTQVKANKNGNGHGAGPPDPNRYRANLTDAAKLFEAEDAHHATAT